MTRKLKAHGSAGWRHVMNRAPVGKTWVADRASAHEFVARLEQLCAALPLDLHGYCLLPRHFHLLVRAEEGVAVEAASALAGETPPRVVPVSFGRHLMEVSRYVHLNPVEAGLAWRPEDWPFSSLRAYFGDPAAPSWLTTAAVLGRFGTIGARHRYRAYVYAGMDPTTRDAAGRPRWEALFGAGSVLEDLAWRIEPVITWGPPRGIEVEARSRPPLAALAREICARLEVPAEGLRSVRLGGSRTALARGALVHAARSGGGYRLADVATWMGYGSPSAAAAAAERFSRALRADRELSERYRAALTGATASSTGT